jgi:AGCS family alanine or glycine:cation symporter
MAVTPWDSWNTCTCLGIKRPSSLTTIARCSSPLSISASVMMYLLSAAGIWFTFRCGFIQFRSLRYIGKSLKNSLSPQQGGLTSFQALCTSLAARVGSGNLAGVALAITAGGPGAVFWMWVTAIIGMATSFAECSLAQLYKEPDRQGQFRGGPAWYMARGLGMRWMGMLFSIFLLVAYGLLPLLHHKHVLLVAAW